MAPLGTPAAPIDITMAVTITTICPESGRLIPNTWAMKRTVTPSNSAVPFMHMVAPRGTTKPHTSGGNPSESSQTSNVVGSVAFEELVEKAVKIALQARRKKSHGDQPVNNLMSTG